jgi:hypothetical protein
MNVERFDCNFVQARPNASLTERAARNDKVAVRMGKSRGLRKAHNKPPKGIASGWHRPEIKIKIQ